MTSINGRHNQQERGISVNQDKIPPKLTKEQRLTMSVDERKAYNAIRLKEYRNAYSSTYAKVVISSNRAEVKQEKKDAYLFYLAHKKQQIPV